MKITPLLALCIATGCTPLSAPTPFHFAESTEVLGRKDVAITASGGAGYAGLDGNAGGGGLRVGVGLGGNHELRAEGTALWVDTQNQSTNTAPWQGRSAAWAGKASWKYAPIPWLALITGAGGSSSSTGNAAGGDLAIILGSPIALGGYARPYGGLRGGFVVPVGRPIDEAGGVTGDLVVAGGIGINGPPWLRVFFEGGVVALWNHGFTETTADSNRDAATTRDHGGGYFAVGVQLILSRFRK